MENKAKMIKRILKVIKRVLIISSIAIFSLLILLIFIVGIPRYSYETFLIKRQFAQNNATIIKMIPEGELYAKYDVYFTSDKEISFVITDVTFRDKEIKFNSVFKLDENLQWGDKIKLRGESLNAALKEIDNFCE